MNFSFAKSILSTGMAAGALVTDSIRDSFIYGFEQLNAQKEDLYAAKWGDIDTIASTTGKGWTINGNLFLRSLNNDTCRNFFVAGNTGAGKTSTIAIPQLLNAWGQSFIVYDPAGSTMPVLPYLESQGYKIYVIDPNDENSDTLNPLDFANSPNDYGKVAAHFGRSSNTEKLDFWTISAIALNRLIISIVMQQPKKFRTMANVQRFLTAMAGDREKADELVARTANDRQYKEYKALVNSAADKTLSSIILTCQTALELFNTPSVARLTSSTNINIESFRTEPSILIIKTATMDADFYKSLISVLVESMIGVFFKEIANPKTDRHVMFIIDECASLSIDSLPTICANNRKHFISLALFYQSVSQLYNHFEQESGTTVLANCHNKLFLNADYRTASELEQIMGKRTVQDANGQKKVEPLMPTQRILTLDPREAIFLKGNYPYKVKVKPFYEQAFLRNKMQEYQRPLKPILSSIPLLSL